MKIYNKCWPIALLLVSTLMTGQPVTGGNMPTFNKSETLQAVAIAKATLSKETGVAETIIKVGKVQAVTWPDSSLGCGKAGMDYLQALVEGYRIQLYVRTVEYRVHVGNGKGIVCHIKSHGKTDRSVLDNKHQTKQSEYGLLVKAIQKSQQQLMFKLQLPKTAVQLSHTKSVLWNEVSDQCNSTEKQSFQPNTRGYLIAFKNKESNFNYFSDGNKVIECQ